METKVVSEVKKGGGRKKGSVKYNIPLLLSQIKFIVPTTKTGWEQVADGYHNLLPEAEKSKKEYSKRDFKTIRSYFISTLLRDKAAAEKGNKEMSETTQAALEIRNLINDKLAQTEVGGESSDDEYDVNGVDDEEDDDEEEEEEEAPVTKKAKVLPEKSPAGSSLPKTKSGRTDKRGSVGQALKEVAQTLVTQNQGVSRDDMKDFADEIGEKSLQQTNSLISELRNMQQMMMQQQQNNMMMMMMMGKKPEEANSQAASSSSSNSSNV